MTKVKYLCDIIGKDLEDSINDFIKDKIVKDIKFTTVNDGSIYKHALIIYEEGTFE